MDAQERFQSLPIIHELQLVQAFPLSPVSHQERPICQAPNCCWRAAVKEACCLSLDSKPQRALEVKNLQAFFRVKQKQKQKTKPQIIPCIFPKNKRRSAYYQSLT